jgi:hypothetical protein
VADVITDVHGITAANGWFVVHGGSRVSTVACFALVSSFDKELGVATGKLVIPISSDEIGEDLLGKEIDPGREIEHDQDPLAAFRS